MGAKEAAREKALALVAKLWGLKDDKGGKKTLSLGEMVAAARARAEEGLPPITALNPPDKPDKPTPFWAQAPVPETVMGPSKKVYTSTSLCCLKPGMWPRKHVCTRVRESKLHG